MSVALVERAQGVVRTIERKLSVILEDMRPPEGVVEVSSVVIKPPQPREVDDDWFELLDVALQVPGILPFCMSCFVVT